MSSSSLSSSLSSSSSSTENLLDNYPNGFFENNNNNLLNSNGNMEGSAFSFSQKSNRFIMLYYSGNGIHNLKLENVDTGQILADGFLPGVEIKISEVAAQERLRVFIDSGTSGDILNSYEVKFRIAPSTDSSSIESESFSSRSTESSSSTVSLLTSSSDST